MVGAFLRTFFEGLDIKCSLAAYALLNDRDGEGYGMEKKRLSVRPIMLGLATAMGAYLVLLTLAAYLTVSGRLDEVRIGQAVWACACLSAFGGAMMTLRGKRGVAVLPLDPPQSVHLGIALPEEEHVSPAAKRFITYALDRLPELDVL